MTFELLLSFYSYLVIIVVIIIVIIANIIIDLCVHRSMCFDSAQIGADHYNICLNPVCRSVLDTGLIARIIPAATIILFCRTCFHHVLLAN